MAGLILTMNKHYKRRLRRRIAFISSVFACLFVLAFGIRYILISPIAIEIEEPVEDDMTEEFLEDFEEKESSLIIVLQNQNKIQQQKIEKLTLKLNEKEPDEDLKEESESTMQTLLILEERYRKLLSDHNSVVENLKKSQNDQTDLETQIAEYQKTITMLQESRNTLRQSLTDMYSSKELASAEDIDTRTHVVSEEIDSYSRIHLVSKGESLTEISLRYYGSENRWDDIYEANKDIIYDKNSIKTGTALVIP